MRIVISLAAALASLAISAKENAKIDSNQILEKAEFIRNPVEDYVIKVELLDKKSGKSQERRYETFLKGRNKALVKYVQPVAENKTRVLMVDQDMWVHVPTSTKPVRVSAKQKITGNAAYGDIARLSFVGNYNAKLIREDKYENKTPAFVLELTSIEGRPVTYDLIEYWVAVKTFRPLKAIYKTSSGKVMREGIFEEYEAVFGVERPTKVVLVNSLQSDHVTTLKFRDSQKKELPDLFFEKQNLGRN